MMESTAERKEKGRARFLRLVGVVLLGAGLLAGFLGPAEMFCFYLFSAGGPFHYEGFRFGSFMFGNLAAQITGYYFIAAVLIPIGYGTIRLRSWARHLTLAILRFWIVAGLPLIVAFFFVLVSSKDISLPVAVLAGLLLAASHLLLPGFVNWFYGSPDTARSFETENTDATWIEATPIPVLALGYVCAFFILILHTQIFFNGMFPLFGIWLSGLEGILLIDLSIVLLSVMLWGMIRTQRWAWWAGLVYFCMMSISYTITLMLSSWGEMLSVLNPPAYEMQLLQRMPLHGSYFAVLAGIPFLLTIASIVRVKSYFKS